MLPRMTCKIMRSLLMHFTMRLAQKSRRHGRFGVAMNLLTNMLAKDQTVYIRMVLERIPIICLAVSLACFLTDLEVSRLIDHIECRMRHTLNGLCAMTINNFAWIYISSFKSLVYYRNAVFALQQHFKSPNKCSHVTNA